jgi:cytochrome c oxidase assembly protein subunit 15
MVKDSKTAPLELWYRRIARISIGAVLFLILVGGIVRSTGSGMGCPDWPKCFGLLVPPTQVDEIPQSFFESHPQFESKTFNAFQTWTEYINRLVGATIGLLMFLTAVLSLSFFRKDRRVFFLSLGSMLLTGFEAWLGKLVVDKNLEGGMVTIHLLVAMVIVALLILANWLVGRPGRKSILMNGGQSKQLVWLGLGVIVLTVGQILIGTKVRESVDVTAQALGMMNRSEWLQGSLSYSVHKIGWLVLAGAVAVWIRNLLTQFSDHRIVKRLAIGLIICIAAEICFGIVLANFDLPAMVQPLHMLFANLIFAAEFAIWIEVVGQRQQEVNVV